MNVFHYSLYLFLLTWGIFCNWTFFAIYLSVLGGYFFMASRIPDSKYNSLRSKLRIASWVEPLEGNIRSRYEIDVTKITQFLESLPFLFMFGFNGVKFYIILEKMDQRSQLHMLSSKL